MARPSKNAEINYSDTHDLTHGLLERAICPAGSPFVLLRDKEKKGLRLRITKAGGKHWQFETRIKGKLFTRSLGRWPDVTIEAAKIEANRLQGMTGVKKDPRDIERAEREKREAEEAAKAAQKLAIDEAEAEKAALELAARKYSLESLLKAYCDHLQRLERRSHKDARSIFNLHVFQEWPEIAALPASAITAEQIADMMRRVIESGKERTANKLRSYIRAAYQVAKASRSKASIPLLFKEYGIKSNPASETEPDESANNTDKNPLSADDMRQYWQTIKPMPGFIGHVLRLHLLTGGQRIEQLVSLLTSNVTPEAITLFDGKGRPGKAPRPHTVPLIPAAAAALEGAKPSGAFAISTDGGATHVNALTLSRWASKAGKDITDFQAKRIRSGVETLLASARISGEHRGRLQSHGISGVQSRHYDGHHYLDEKREALETLFDLLEGKKPTTGKVVALKAT